MQLKPVLQAAGALFWWLISIPQDTCAHTQQHKHGRVQCPPFVGARRNDRYLIGWDSGVSAVASTGAGSDIAAASRLALKLPTTTIRFVTRITARATAERTLTSGRAATTSSVSLRSVMNAYENFPGLQSVLDMRPLDHPSSPAAKSCSASARLSVRPRSRQ